MRRAADKKDFASNSEASNNKNKLSGSMAIDRNCAEASGRGNWRKRKWQIKINWWSNSAA